MFRPFRFYFTVLALVLSGHGLAADESLFEQGVAASQRGEHRAALEYFERARRAGREDGRLYYNLGVSHYQLAHYDKAVLAFTRAAEDPHLKALAYYNLALVAVAENDSRQAALWLQRCRQVSDDGKLDALVEALQTRLEKNEQQEAASSGNAFIAFNSGYDNNVLLRADSLLLSAADQGDFFWDLFAFGRVALQGVGSDSSLDVSAYLLRYADLDRYNLGFVRIGAVTGRHLAAWQLKPALHAASYALGGDALYRTLSLGIDGQRKLMDSARLKLTYQVEKINEADVRYAYLAGWRHQFKARSTWLLPRSERLQFEYVLEVNDRQDLAGATTFTSYSPLRHSLKLKSTRPLSSLLTASLALHFRDSRYRDSNIFADSSRLRRAEQRYDFLAQLTRSWRDDVAVEAEYRFTSNQSNLTPYDYSRHQIQLGVSLSY